MMMEPRIESNAWLDERDTWNTWIVGRLKPKVSPTQAEADLNAVAAEMARQFPDVNGDRKSTRLNSSHGYISYAVFCLKKTHNQEPPGRRVFRRAAERLPGIQPPAVNARWDSALGADTECPHFETLSRATTQRRKTDAQ